MNEDCLTVDDITAVIRAVEPNLDHDVDFDEAMRRAESNRPLMDAACDYDQHRNAARSTAGELSRLMWFGRFKRPDAITILVGDCAEEKSIGWDDATTLVDWLLNEAKRFEELDVGEC